MNSSRRSEPAIADVVVQSLLAGGVKNLFGMLGGGSGTELIESAQRAGLPFVVSHTEAAGAFMACAQAEILGRPGACLATLGPGAASVADGAAHAYLDRVGLVVLTDRLPTTVRDFAPAPNHGSRGPFCADHKGQLGSGVGRERWSNMRFASRPRTRRDQSTSIAHPTC